MIRLTHGGPKSATLATRPLGHRARALYAAPVPLSSARARWLRISVLATRQFCRQPSPTIVVLPAVEGERIDSHKTALELLTYLICARCRSKQPQQRFAPFLETRCRGKQQASVPIREKGYTQSVRGIRHQTLQRTPEKGIKIRSVHGTPMYGLVPVSTECTPRQAPPDQRRKVRATC